MHIAHRKSQIAHPQIANLKSQNPMTDIHQNMNPLPPKADGTVYWMEKGFFRSNTG
jgi:hypothetical protein